MKRIPARNFDAIELGRAKLLTPRVYLDMLREIGGDSESDRVVLAYLSALQLAVAGERPLDFDELWDQICTDPRLADEDVDLLTTVAVELFETDLQIVEERVPEKVVE